MVVRRNKKSRKMRGSRTHGYGTIGQHRKAGSRGGRGAAGLHKHKWTWTVKYHPDWYGKHGFKNPTSISEDIIAINVGRLNEIVDELIASGKIKATNDFIEIDLATLGYNKLLGGGSVNKKLRIKTMFATEEAIRKVKEAGGEVIVLSTKKEGE
ncbi:MAG: 50S ribosomal protein L15 [Zestosphaera tikiterensis]|uniref:Large ribosomal subunit protein uL15 n=1 Tax=Zestosphaera tikiterensis TaxID=1973259 RepID=A0A2R7Y790_9CREN|nr:MAG: 50S ribosomal protein L15 [Zestosphaera tikiterensis]